MISLLLILLMQVSIAQYDKSWSFLLPKAPTALKIASSGRSNHQYIVTGYATGQLEVIDAHTKQIVKEMQLLDEGVSQIEIDAENGIGFVVGSINMVQLDHQYNIRKVFSYPQNFTQLSLSKFDEKKRFINFQTGKQVISLQYDSERFNHSHFTHILNHDGPYSIAQVSPKHQYVYIVSGGGQKFRIQKMFPQIAFNSSKISFVTQHYLQRVFSFKIKQLLFDNKFNTENDEQLLMITQQGTIFYTRAGNIITFIPYSITKNEHLVAVQFCQTGFIAIVHERRVANDRSDYLLTLIRQDNLLSHKVILLNEIFGDISGIQRMDCNHNLIVLQGKANEFFILESFRVFSLEEYITEILIILSITIIILYFICRRPNKTIQANSSDSSSQGSKQKNPESDSSKPSSMKQEKSAKKLKKIKRKGD